MAPQQRGPAAEDIAELWWIYLLVGIAVYVLVLVLLVIPWLRRRREPPADVDPPAPTADPEHRADVPARLATGWIVGLGVVMPLDRAGRRPRPQRVDDAGARRGTHPTAA